jgi:Mrp family chromosome partitioning ATPase
VVSGNGLNKPTRVASGHQHPNPHMHKPTRAQFLICTFVHPALFIHAAALAEPGRSSQHCGAYRWHLPGASAPSCTYVQTRVFTSERPHNREDPHRTIPTNACHVDHAHQPEGNRSMHTLAVVHHKGGVGKTTTTAHLGHALATGQTASRVLLVDLDPQASLTRLVGITPGTGDVGYAAAIEDQQLQPHVTRSDDWHLDVLPAGQRHARIERSSDPGTEQQLRLLLEQAVGQWDHVLIDAPGSLGMLTTTALAAASGGVIVPTTPDYLALEPLKTIIRLINTIQAAYQPGCILRGGRHQRPSQYPGAFTPRHPAPAGVRRPGARHHPPPHGPPGHRVRRAAAHQDPHGTRSRTHPRLPTHRSPAHQSPHTTGSKPVNTRRNARRNALDDDILADLGISAAESAQPATLPSRQSDSAPGGSPEPPARTKRIGVDITEELWIATKVIAARQGKTVAEIIRTHLQSLDIANREDSDWAKR